MGLEQGLGREVATRGQGATCGARLGVERVVRHVQQVLQALVVAPPHLVKEGCADRRWDGWQLGCLVAWVGAARWLHQGSATRAHACPAHRIDAVLWEHQAEHRRTQQRRQQQSDGHSNAELLGHGWRQCREMARDDRLPKTKEG